MQTRIVAAYAGTGKTTLAKTRPDKYVDFVAMPYKYYLPNICESESEHHKADFSLEMREEWPQNYVAAILHELEQHNKTLLIPTASNVLQLLQVAKIGYFLCYPMRELKEEYRRRYLSRGNNRDFLSVFIDGWGRFLDSLEASGYGEHITLGAGAYLSNVFSD